MARASFRLRNNNIDQGSYLQYPVGGSASASYTPRTDNDNTLRADDLLLAPTDSGFAADQGAFEATVLDYQLVKLQWNVLLQQTLGATPVPYQAIVKYSADGYCQTIQEGITLRETTYSDVLNHTVPDNVLWAYYTLFIRYKSTGSDDYYEPVANVKVMMPKNYGSSMDLFKRIPEYYRGLDNQQAPTEDTGPLYRFLSIAGWDIDRIRTTLDYIMTMRDPLIADQEALDTLALDFGLPLQSHELGVSRIRALLDNIGDIRRGKGTSEIIIRTFRLLTGCAVDYDTSVNPNQIKVYAQRVNLIADPRFRTGITGSIDGGYPGTSYLAGASIDAGVVGSSQTDGTYDGGASVNPNYTGGGTSPTSGGWKTYADFLNPGTNILEQATAGIKLKTGDVVYFSAHCGPEVHSIISNVYLYTGSYGDGGSIKVAESTTMVTSGNSTYWRLEIPEGYSNYTNMMLVIRYEDSLLYNANNFDYFLLERNIIDDYFDGDSTRGGWIVDSGGSVGDFAWSGTANESPSVYTSNYQKVKTIVQQYIPNILPVTQLVTSGTVYSNRRPTTNLKYTISWNNIPGV